MRKMNVPCTNTFFRSVNVWEWLNVYRNFMSLGTPIISSVSFAIYNVNLYTVRDQKHFLVHITKRSCNF